MEPRLALRLAALTGFLAVALGAFGAHGMKDLLVKNGTASVWETAAMYHLIHAAVLLTLALHDPVPRTPFILILVGIVIFSGSLYFLAATGVTILGAITPIGGLSLLAGWLWLPFAWRR